jgi:glycosyltransferase involved in cell wall biosynthesis
MRITVLTVCYNEEEMIYSFLAHYAGLGVNRIVVYNNKSTDRTVEICNEFAKDYPGCKIEIVDYDTNGQIRDDVYLEIKNNAWKNYKSDYYIVVDCDEFLEVKDGDQFDKKRLVRYLSTMKKGYVLPKVIGVQTVTDSFEDLFDLGSANDKKYVLDDTFNKRCIFSRELVPVYRPGCHMFGVNPKDKAKLETSLAVESKVEPLYLFHLKYVDRQYVIKRYAEFKTRLSEFNKKHNYGHQYEMDEKTINLKFDYFKRYAITRDEVFANA